MKMSLSLAVALLFVGFSFSACFKNPDPVPCTYDACANKAPATEIAAVQAYLDSMQIIGATQHCSGVFYKIETPGTGRTPEACSDVLARYTGMLTNGQVFDSSSAGTGFNLLNVIPGWTNTVPLIKEGGKITLYIPPSLAYGSQPRRDREGNIVIPANSILIFDVGLISLY